jgi:hypothetical protein
VLQALSLVWKEIWEKLKVPISSEGVTGGTSSLFTGDRDWKIGGGVSVFGAGGEYRQDFDASTGVGKFKKSNNIEVDLTPFAKVEYQGNGNSGSSVIKIGLPEVKAAAFFGFKFGAFVSIKPVILSTYEKTQKRALEARAFVLRTTPEINK